MCKLENRKPPSHLAKMKPDIDKQFGQRMSCKYMNILGLYLAIKENPQFSRKEVFNGTT